MKSFVGGARVGARGLFLLLMVLMLFLMLVVPQFLVSLLQILVNRVFRMPPFDQGTMELL